MPDTVLTARGLYARVREQHALSEALHARTREALARSRAAQAAVHVREVCGSPRPLAAGDFRLRGTVGGLPVGAVWDGSGLRATAPLLAQARLVVALGDVLGDGSPAALTSSRAALLTLARACDRVVCVEIGGRAAEVAP